MAGNAASRPPASSPASDPNSRMLCPGVRGALAALRLVHPFPSVLNAVASVALAAVAVDGWPGWSLALRLALTMLAAQCAIGIINDVVDRDLDAATKPWKPIPAGLIAPAVARRLGILAILAALAVGSTLGFTAWALSTAGMVVGLAYDLRLKRTPWSGLTYAVALPLVPLWVWTAVDRFTAALFWVVPIGLLLGAALQVLNALPDMDGDTVHGVRGTAQRLGRRSALAAAWGGYLSAILLAVGLGLLLGHNRSILVGGAGTALLLLAVAIGTWMRRPGAGALQLGWTLLAPGAGILAVSWLAALP